MVHEDKEDRLAAQAMVDGIHSETLRDSMFAMCGTPVEAYKLVLALSSRLYVLKRAFESQKRALEVSRPFIQDSDPGDEHGGVDQ